VNPAEYTCTRLAEAVRKGEIGAEEAAEGFLRRVERYNGRLNALLWCDPERVLEEARRVDRKRARGEPLGRLAGVPVAVKDNICIKDVPTTCGSRMLENYRPPYTAFVVERIAAEDGVVLGKANMDEFAMGSSSENSAFGPVRNPRDLSRVPGGSSGGSAAAVAAGLCPAALGSDTGGSIRQPASHTGVVGLKPTYGRVSRFGLVAFGSSLDQVGPLARTVEDAALLLSVISAPDERDGTHCRKEAFPPRVEPVEDFSALRVGVPSQYVVEEGIREDVLRVFNEARRMLEEAGARCVEVDLPHTRYAVAVYYIIACAEASSNLARYDGVHYGYRAERYEGMVSMMSRSRSEGFGAEVKRRILLGTHVLSAGYYDAYYIKALKVRRLLMEDFTRAFEACDVILCPVAPTPAFKIGELVDDPLQMYLSDVFTIPANLAGLPAVSVPAGFSGDGLPVGIQFVGPQFADERVLGCAAGYERMRGFEAAAVDPEEGA